MKSFVARHDPDGTWRCEECETAKGKGEEKGHEQREALPTFEEATRLSTHTFKAVTPSITRKDDKRRGSSSETSEKRASKEATAKIHSRPRLTLPAKPRLSRGETKRSRAGGGKGEQKNEKVRVGDVIEKRATPQRAKAAGGLAEQGRKSDAERRQGSREGSSVQLNQSVAGGFTSARGSMIRFSKDAMEAVKKLCFDEVEELNMKGPNDPKRRRLSENSHPTGFKLPRAKESKSVMPSKCESVMGDALTAPPIHPSKQDVTSEITVERRSTFSGFGIQENCSADPRRSSCLPSGGVNGRRITLGAVMEQRRLGHRCSKGWRPLKSLPVQESVETERESPLAKLSLELFDASRTMCPKKAAGHVFSNGASTLSMYGALIDMGMAPTLQWVKQQYRCIVWQLSGLMQEETSALTADNTFLELKYRFAVEKSGRKGMSILEDLAESGAIGYAVLLVADILSSESHTSGTIELSDGWNQLVANVDERLSERCEAETIQAGSLLFVERLSVQKTASGKLEACIASNSCIPVPGDTPIGRAMEGCFFLPLHSISIGGGIISTTWLCIYRMYPVLFQHKAENDRCIYLTRKQHQKRLQDYEHELDRIRSRAQDIVHEEQMRHFKSVVQKKRAGENVDPIEFLYAECYTSQTEPEELNVAEREELASFKEEHEKSLEMRLTQQMEQLKEEQRTMAPPEIPRLSVHVTEVTRSTEINAEPACLHIWLQEMMTSDAFREGDVFEFRDVEPVASPSDKCLILNAGRQSRFKKISTTKQLPSNLSVHFVPRMPLSDFTNSNSGGLFDMEAFVLPGHRSKTLVCVDAQTAVLDTTVFFILVSMDAFDTLSHLRSCQIWSLTDLEFISSCKRERTTMARVTEKTACTPLKPPGKLEKLKAQYKLKRKTIDAHIAQLLSSL